VISIKYLGSKSRIAKHIVPILQKEIDDNNINTYIEPFCGGCNLVDKIECDRRIKPSQLKPTRHPPMPDTTIPKATMPDYDKVCMLLNEIGCKFTKQGTMESGNILTIEIDSESIISFGGVAIDFYNDGSFKGFVACE